MGRAKFAAILTRSNTSRELILAEVRQLTEVIELPPLPQPVCCDPDDDKVLALAVAAKADWIISGDSDLLSLGRYAGIAIVPPAAALALIAGG
jgi:putative PIN family toxin of toxin-antitoxin system